jgi:hypothetical protein
LKEWEKIAPYDLGYLTSWIRLVSHKGAIYAYGQAPSDTSKGIYQSIDLGKTWEQIATIENPDVSAMTVFNGELYLGTEADADDIAYIWKLDLGAKSKKKTKIEAESFDAQRGIKIGTGGGVTYVGWIGNNDFIMFEDVDFGSKTHQFKARVASNTSGGKITLRLGSKNGIQIGSCAVPGTHGWEKWETVTCQINPVSGITRKLYLVFGGSGRGLFNLDWILFATSSDGPDDVIDAHARIQAESFDAQKGVNTGIGSGGITYVGWIRGGDYIMFEKVDFGTKTNQFKARVATNSSGGDITLRLGSQTGTRIGACAVQSTNGWENWKNVTCNINQVSGVTQKLYLVFSGSGYGLFNIDWFTFDNH